MDGVTGLWILAGAMVIAGMAGTVLPAMPGPALVFAGILIGAWAEDFQRISGWTVMVAGLLTLLAWGADYVSAMLGAKRAGASRQAIVGAFIGTLLGIFSGLWGLLFMPLAGAAIGEYLADRDAARAAHVGISTWVGLMVGTVFKVAVTFMMVGLFLFAIVF
jgi:uncharacterized protein YqgC (DUF456 family)